MRCITKIGAWPLPVSVLLLASWLRLTAPSFSEPWVQSVLHESHSPYVSHQPHNRHHQWSPPEESRNAVTVILDCSAETEQNLSAGLCDLPKLKSKDYLHNYYCLVSLIFSPFKLFKLFLKTMSKWRQCSLNTMIDVKWLLIKTIASCVKKGWNTAKSKTFTNNST